MTFFLQTKNAGFVNVDHVVQIGIGVTHVGDKERGVVILVEGKAFKLRSNKLFAAKDAVSEMFKQLKTGK